MWAETTSVTVTDGVFSVILGSDNPLDRSIFEDGTTWLGVKVGADHELSPRKQLLSVPYAIQAHRADTASVSLSSPAGEGGWTDNGSIVSTTTSTDRVTINSSSTIGKLAVGNTGTAIWAGASSMMSSGVYGQSSGSTGSGVRGYATGGAGKGVYGMADSSADIGVYGYAQSITNGIGVQGVSEGNGDGVYGYGEGTGVGVRARSDHGTGIFGISYDNSNGIGIYGACDSTGGVAVKGTAPGTNGKGILGIATGYNGTGVRGEGVAYGTYSLASGSNGVGIYASAPSGSGTGIEVWGGTSVDGKAAKFYGNVVLYGRSSEDVIMELGEGLDYAEAFDISEGVDLAPGTVVAIDSDNPGKLTSCKQAYDKRVAGIIAGANGLGSGVRLGTGKYDKDVALAGRVYCQVEATDCDIEPGDLLTTSPIPGYAMKAADHDKAQGAILGKAMERLEKGQRGMILVLVTLQ